MRQGCARRGVFLIIFAVVVVFVPNFGELFLEAETLRSRESRIESRGV
jgi:hypothetical protein